MDEPRLHSTTARSHVRPGRAAERVAPAARSAARQRVAAGLVVAVPVVLVLLAGWSRRWTSDDAFIDFRVVRNVLDGHGPVFNVGERVEAYTSPMWVGLLTGFSFVTRIGVEWASVILGLLLTCAGFAAAGWAGLLHARRGVGAERSRLLLPFGVLVLAALPPVWDFATSGLETGAEFAWLGISFLLLTRLSLAPAETRRWPIALTLGAGLLVRPEFAVLAFMWTCALLLLTWSGWRRAAATVLLVLAPSVGYEVFRMGYFAALLPNTALAKEAGEARWSDGLAYLADTFAPYLLVVPVALLVLYWLDQARRSRFDRRTATLHGATLAGAVLYGLYVVRLGGDFMHARMLLPPLFALALPVAVVAVSGLRQAAMWAAVAVWAAVCTTSLRVPFATGPDHPINDERTYWASVAHNPNPVTLADHATGDNVWIGFQLRQMAASERVVILWSGVTTAMPRVAAGTTLASAPEPVVATLLSIGQPSFAAGPSVYVVDRRGLADVIGARLAIVDPRAGRVGHQKLLPDVWVLARFADPSSLRGLDAAQSAQVAAARRTLTCGGPLQALLTATSAALTPGQFLSNLAHSWEFTQLRLSADPVTAEAALCR